MADPISEGLGRAPSHAAAAASVPEVSELNDPCWPESPEARSGFTDNALADYRRRLNQFDLLTAEQEVELAQDIEAGLFAAQLLAAGTARPGQDPGELRTIVRLGKRAADDLLLANLRLVVSIAKHYTHRGLDLADLIQEGNLGLHQAVRTFDFSRGFRFSTHSTWHIRSAITLALARQGRLIRLPAVVVAQLREIRSAQRTASMTWTVCSTGDLSRLTGSSIGKVECLLALAEPVLSLESWGPDGRGGAEALAEQLWDPYCGDAADAVFHQQLRAQVRAVLGTLWELEAEIIVMRFGLMGGEGKSLDAVAKAFGLPRDRIRHIEMAALQKLRDPSRSTVLRQYHFDCEGPPADLSEAAFFGREPPPESAPAALSPAAPATVSPAAPATAGTPQTPLRRVPASPPP